MELELRIPEEQADKRFWRERGIDRILVVGSEQETCENIQVLMKDTEVVVDTACDLQAAVNMISESNRDDYHLILLDWDETELGGISAAQKLRECTAAPILFLASYEAKRTESVAEMENAEVLCKPFFVSALKEKILEMQEAGKVAAKLEEEDNNSLEGLHFLAAEDNMINAEILSEILSMEGASCEVAENGKLVLERFERAQEGEFDAILMDVQMPVMNGYDATRAIRALNRSDAAKIPIIAMTANAFAEDEKEALAAGMDVHLAKPIDIGLLKKVINRYVNGKE